LIPAPALRNAFVSVCPPQGNTDPYIHDEQNAASCIVCACPTKQHQLLYNMHNVTSCILCFCLCVPHKATPTTLQYAKRHIMYHVSLFVRALQSNTNYFTICLTSHHVSCVTVCACPTGQHGPLHNEQNAASCICVCVPYKATPTTSQ
jgi:hypothetical protein